MDKNGDDAAMDGTDATVTQTAQLAHAYAVAHYFVTIGRREWLFCVGQHAEEIEPQLEGQTYLFITAWNPAPEAATAAENLQADERLEALIRDSGLPHYRSLGSNAQGGAVEYGWLVVDAPESLADAWGREFGQAATLYWRRGQAVRLRMLWPRPVGLADDPYTDWASDDRAS